MSIGLKRAYDPPQRSDGYRVLVDRIWPRGITKDDLRVDAWLKDLAPSTGLREWFGHDPKKWDEFRQRYAKELEQRSAVNVGNPHAIFFVDDCDAVELDRLGPTIEHDPLFPERVNVNVATVENDGSIRLRVWERGAGLTRACGTGACATAVAAMRRGMVEPKVTVALPGGELTIEWSGGPITMTGAAAESFRGTFEWSDYA